MDLMSRINIIDGGNRDSPPTRATPPTPIIHIDFTISCISLISYSFKGKPTHFWCLYQNMFGWL